MEVTSRTNDHDNEDEDDDWCCPITLEPLSQLPYPPFGLSPTGNDSYKYFFDGVALATYMVSRGLFENPLTRESLTLEDCQRLDHHLETSCRHRSRGVDEREIQSFPEGRFPQGVPQVSEAFALRQRIRVGSSSGTSDTTRLDAERRRLEVLRSEAVSALHGLFVYGSRRGRRRRRPFRGSSSYAPAAPQQEAVNPHFGFHLAAAPPTAGVWECDGLTIIDHDEVQAHAAEVSSWQQLQNDFPTLPSKNNKKDSTIRSSRADDEDDKFVRMAREVAHRTRQEEEQRALALAEMQARREAEAERKRVERLQQQARSHAQQRAVAEQERLLAAELAQARQEIEEWRQDLWRRWERQREGTEQQRTVAKEQPEEVESTTQSSEPSLVPTPQADVRDANKDDGVEKEEDENSTEDDPHEPQQRQQAVSKEDRKKAKATEKRRRARERIKAKKAEEREQQRKAEEEQTRRQASAKKCAACGRGILDVGFERLNHLFCTTKCARAGPQLPLPMSS